MAKIIIIENDPKWVQYSIACLGAEHYKSFDKFNNPTWQSRIRTRLENDGFQFEQLSSIKEVQQTYAQGLPDSCVIVLDENIEGGSTQQLFHLFSTKAKESTLCLSGNQGFINILIPNLFNRCIFKSMTPEYSKRIGHTLKSLVDRLKK